MGGNNQISSKNSKKSYLQDMQEDLWQHSFSDRMLPRSLTGNASCLDMV